MKKKKLKEVSSKSDEKVFADKAKALDPEVLEIKKPVISKNMKTILVAISFIIIFLLTSFGAFGIYVYSQRAQKTLEFNSALYSNFDNVNYIRFDSDYTGEVRLLTDVPRIDEVSEQIPTSSNNKVTKVYRFANEGITQKLFPDGVEVDDSDYGNGITKSKLVNSDILFLFFSDEDLWKEILNNKKYKVEEVSQNDEKLWRYTLDTDVANKLFVENFKQSIIDGYNSDGPTQVGSEAVTTEFDGNVSISFDMNQKSKNLSKVQFSIDKDMYFHFNDQISDEFAAIYANPGEELKLKFILKSGYTQNSTITKISYESESGKFTKMQPMDQVILSL